MSGTQAPLPQGIRILAWSRAIRWAGWGLGESLLPIFIFTFSATFAGAGFLKSSYDIAFLLVLPFVGNLGDRVPARTLVLAGLALYPLVGISYFLAGIFGLGTFIILARLIGAVCWSLDDIGIDTYVRRMGAHLHMAPVFGYIDSLGNMSWIVAALLSIPLVSFVPVHYLLFAIAPAAFVAFLFTTLAPQDTEIPRGGASILGSYKEIFRILGTWGPNFRLQGALAFFLGIVTSLVAFFIPIEAYVQGAHLEFVVLLGIAATVPSLFGYPIGRIAARVNKNGLIVFGLALITLMIGLLALFPFYAFKLAACFLLATVLEGFHVVQKDVITGLSVASAYGRCASSFEGISTIGTIAAPILIGVAFDTIGVFDSLIVLAGIAFLITASFAVLHMRSGGKQFVT